MQSNHTGVIHQPCLDGGDDTASYITSAAGITARLDLGFGVDGGRGNDNLIGGDGTDTFVFNANWGVDIVWDWQNGVEQFDMSGSGAANYAALTVDQNVGGSGNALVSFGADQILIIGGANQIDETDFSFV